MRYTGDQIKSLSCQRHKSYCPARIDERRTLAVAAKTSEGLPSVPPYMRQQTPLGGGVLQSLYSYLVPLPCIVLLRVCIPIYTMVPSTSA